MIAVIFEVKIKGGEKDRYLGIAADLKQRLEQVDGFLSVERFQSLTNPEKLLSLSFFRDEDAVLRWRQLEEHRQAQALGRSDVFDGYRLRVASVIRDYGMTDRDEVPKESLQAHDRNAE
ncbi:antibiotic biosynthesis monooxygenase [uncultured Pelagimonas sp.]|uniref:antibiotic biosynthesis monooxygenase family protein n=1 Tax=uncultured Pelagimonas sp. TaxID=1618102 RepID=UPI002626D919|nr:antibiotic biosynthesis monooxygenase [uncultured Pelagimonas sp.]